MAIRATILITVTFACVSGLGSMAGCAPPGVPGDGSHEESTGSDTSNTSMTEPDPSDDTSNTGTDDPTFKIEADMANTCEPYVQECPAGQKCVPHSAAGGFVDDLKCVEVLGDRAPGETCTYAGTIDATDNCDGSSYCWGAQRVDGELQGICRAFCTGGPDVLECPVGSHCMFSGSGVVSLCIPGCDPVAQDCDDGLGCDWIGDYFTCLPSRTAIEVGEPCDFIGDCTPGATCIAAQLLPACDGPSCCAPFCDRTLGDWQCDGLPGTICEPWYDDDVGPPVDHIGVCAAF